MSEDVPRPKPSESDESLPDPLEEERIKTFIKVREIKEEDKDALRELAKFSNQLIILHLHNLFNGSKERSLPELEREIDSVKRSIKEADGDQKLINKYQEVLDLLEVVKPFAEKYHWTTCYNMIRVFEDR